MCLNESIQPLNMSKNETRKTYLRNIPSPWYPSDSSRAPPREMTNAPAWKLPRSYWARWGVSVKLHSNDLSAWLFGAQPEKKARYILSDTEKLMHFRCFVFSLPCLRARHPHARPPPPPRAPCPPLLRIILLSLTPPNGSQTFFPRLENYAQSGRLFSHKLLTVAHIKVVLQLRSEFSSIFVLHYFPHKVQRY